jgi:glycosyltransferase involved in cell wall biosynthesis
MHILLICSTYPEHNDARRGVFFRDQARALKAARHRVGVLVVNGISPNDFLLCRNADPVISFEDGIPVYRSVRLPIPIRNADSLLHLWSMTAPAAWLFKRYINNEGHPDILHAQNFFYAGLAGIRIKSKRELPLVITEHSSAFLRDALSEKQKQLFSRNIGAVDRCMAVSSALAKTLTELVPGLSVEVVGNMVDTDYFKPMLSPSKKDFAFLIAASLDENKRVGDAIRAFADGFSTDISTKLWICGQGPEEKKLHALAADLNIIRQITFLGSTSRDGLWDYYSRADVVISTSKLETFGLTLLEAMACGKQVGQLVDVGDIHALSAAMKEVYLRINEFDSDLISEYAVSHYSSAQIVNRLVEIYQEVMS